MPLWKRVVISIAGALLGIAGVSQVVSNSEQIVYPVDRVIDGDTIVVVEDNQVLRVRLLGIDAPEKGECYYEESRTYLTELLEGKSVRLEKDISGADKYDRLLRYVLISKGDEEDDIFVNQQMLSEGNAQTYAVAPDTKYRDLFASAQDRALREEKGLWGACAYMRPNEDVREKDDVIPPNLSCTIKGNISEKGYGKTYLIQGCDNYTQVKIDASKGEQYFCSEEEAREAGFRKATNCP